MVIPVLKHISDYATGVAPADATSTYVLVDQDVDSVVTTVKLPSTDFPGTEGPQGVPGAAATIAVGTVTGVPAGTPPTVTNSGSSSAAVFNFDLEQGADGRGINTLFLVFENPQGAIAASEIIGSVPVAVNCTLPATWAGSVALINTPTANYVVAINAVVVTPTGWAVTHIGDITVTSGNNEAVFSFASGIAAGYAIAQDTLIQLVASSGGVAPFIEFYALVALAVV
jgi:hypothetical protein